MIDRRQLLTTSLTLAATAVAAPRKSVCQSIGTTGFFRVEQIDGKWFMLDGRNRPFFMRGMNHYGDGSLMPLNVKQTYGSVDAWRRSVRDRHHEWGFNYLPPSIGPSEPKDDVVAPEANERGGIRWPTEIRRTPEWPARHFAELEYPSAGFLDVPRQYMSGRGLPDVFSKDFRDLVDRRCQEFVRPLRDNPNLIGYHFCHNPPWDDTNNSFHLWLHDITAKPDGRQAWPDNLVTACGSQSAQHRDLFHAVA